MDRAATTSTTWNVNGTSVCTGNDGEDLLAHGSSDSLWHFFFCRARGCRMVFATQKRMVTCGTSHFFLSTSCPASTPRHSYAVGNKLQG